MRSSVVLSSPPGGAQTLDALALPRLVVVERVGLRLVLPTRPDPDLPSGDVLLHRLADVPPNPLVAFLIDRVDPENVTLAIAKLVLVALVHERPNPVACGTFFPNLISEQ